MQKFFPPITLCAAMFPMLVVAGEDYDIAGHAESTRYQGTDGPVETAGLAPFASLFDGAAALDTRLAQADVSASDEQKQRNYLNLVSDEAAQTSPADDGQSGGRPASGPDASEPVPLSKEDQRRMDAIRSIVGEAIAVPRREEVEAKEKEPAITETHQRRKTVRELVRRTPPAQDTAGDSYISTLREEGSATVVIHGKATGASSSGAGGDFDLYTVQRGDSLWLIAKRQYGDGFKWEWIFDANRESMMHEDVLMVGQVLRIPNL